MAKASITRHILLAIMQHCNILGGCGLVKEYCGPRIGKMNINIPKTTKNVKMMRCHFSIYACIFQILSLIIGRYPKNITMKMQCKKRKWQLGFCYLIEWSKRICVCACDRDLGSISSTCLRKAFTPSDLKKRKKLFDLTVFFLRFWDLLT